MDVSVPCHFRTNTGCTHNLEVSIGFCLNNHFLYTIKLRYSIPHIFSIFRWIPDSISININDLEPLIECASHKFDSCIMRYEIKIGWIEGLLLIGEKLWIQYFQFEKNYPLETLNHLEKFFSFFFIESFTICKFKLGKCFTILLRPP